MRSPTKQSQGWVTWDTYEHFVMSILPESTSHPLAAYKLATVAAGLPKPVCPHQERIPDWTQQAQARRATDAGRGLGRSTSLGSPIA